MRTGNDRGLSLVAKFHCPLRQRHLRKACGWAGMGLPTERKTRPFCVSAPRSSLHVSLFAFERKRELPHLMLK